MTKSKPCKKGGLSNGSHAESLLPKLGRMNSYGRTKYAISDLLSEMPQGLPLENGWEEMPEVGLEKE
jgi:hypothetical protein